MHNATSKNSANSGNLASLWWTGLWRKAKGVLTSAGVYGFVRLSYLGAGTLNSVPRLASDMLIQCVRATWPDASIPTAPYAKGNLNLTGPAKLARANFVLSLPSRRQIVR
jgi:hypothetical protein